MNLIKDKLEKIEKEFTEQVKTAFDENGVTFPYNQIYVHGINKSDK